jgi:distribution and morphology protein 34
MIHDTAESKPSSDPVGQAIQDEDLSATPRATVRAHGASVLEKGKQATGSSAGSSRQLPSTILPFINDSPTGGVVDQALVERLAGEIARRIRDEKFMASNACGPFWDRHGQEESPPPAYGH